jgi:catechol 2,3-dioxygenase-like lactoylglutathione lyase family enzyme
MQIAATLPASDLERAKAWYARVLQLEPVEITDEGSAWYQADGTRFLLYQSQFAGTNQATAAGIRVDDVETAVDELRARGAVFEDYDLGDDLRTVDGIYTSPGGQKLAWLKDSEGNILALASI